MPKTTFNEFVFPSENQDPHYVTLKSFFNLNDQLMYTNRLRNYFILAGGGTISFNSSSGLLSWTEDFAIKDAISGYLNVLRYGPDAANREANLQDGQILYVEFPTALTENRTLNLSVANSLNKNTNFYILAFRYSTKVYFKNGVIL